MRPGALIQTAEQMEYPHPEHQRYFLRDLITALEHPDLSLQRGRLEVHGEILPHTHKDCTEVSYILSGKALCTLGDRTYPVSSGSCIVAPPGMPLGLKNTGDQPLELLTLCTPPLS